MASLKSGNLISDAIERLNREAARVEAFVKANIEEVRKDAEAAVSAMGEPMLPLSDLIERATLAAVYPVTVPRSLNYGAVRPYNLRGLVLELDGYSVQVREGNEGVKVPGGNYRMLVFLLPLDPADDFKVAT